MGGFIQGTSVLAIALGSGLVAFSNKMSPQLKNVDPAAMAQFFDNYTNRNDHFTASLTSGVGMGFLILGTLGLVVPWINRLGNSLTGELSETSARTMSTIALWLSVAVILTFGVFSNYWPGGSGLSVLLIIVALICGAASAATAMIFGWRPWLQKGSLAETGSTPGS